MISWSLVAPIGEPSGFGIVFESKKIINGVEQPGDYVLKQLKQLDLDSIERFKREVRYLTKLDHPRIVKCEGYALENEPYFYTMNKYKNSLSAVQPEISRDFSRLKLVYNNVLEGLEYLHSEGYFHRDLKPGNVLLNSDNDLVLCDLGLCVNTTAEGSQRLTRTQMIGGSEYYCSPEQAANSLKYVDHRTDIYSFGKMLYEAFTGERPYVLDLNKVPPAVQAVIRKCNRENRDERYNSVEELRLHFNIAMDLLIEGSEGNNLLQIINDINKFNEYDFLVDQTKIVDRLADALAKIEDEEKLHETMMKINGIVYKYLYTQYPDLVGRIVSEFIEYIGRQGWPFTYTDTLGTKYSVLFKQIDDNEIKEKILLGLLELGTSHNRWSVMGDFTNLLYSVQDDPLAYSVYHSLSEHAYDLEVIGRNMSVDKSALHTVIKKLF
ncbi:serine/threonine-protein kinase [Bacillus toyonensis]|uniref:serine/threonine-protein kinase n=1 Tax=Bacillus toyonensis TaxID=155322 RepID=UPI002405F991|nr:serine/threonine-protein kinase [Bacillus toyonensis]MDF9449480.1 serine/threonine-protein kinase [Bacillus toyonensis]MDG1562529.1 serine/threonine-protein kinase [Bacillus toyonensis]